ncbi:hypothetical protein ACFSCW_03410 [Sphingomonas tabacisoli]|uniref:Uncharacterized protein n=1 Tax=Sphingomonas tabacisoli TaxID=2249466 RepID=A0ABW4I0A0_9SPHN
MTDKVLFLKVADNGTPFSKPSDWNDSANTIICLGAGAGGAAFTSSGGGQPGAGGSSGGIHIATNVTLSSSTQFTVGAGGVGGSASSTATGANGGAGGSTFFGGTALATATVGAQGGQVNASNSYQAGSGGSSFGTAGGTKTTGSVGGFMGGVGWNGCGGGAGAPGPSGAGGAGGSPANSGTSGGSGGGGANGGAAGTAAGAGSNLGAAGGNNRSSTGGGTGGAANTAGGAGTTGGGGGGGGATSGAGGAGSQDGIWTATDGTYAGQTAGPGSGGGAGASANGGAAGGYGAGGGGSVKTSGLAGGAGSDGLIVIIYTPITGGGSGTVRRYSAMSLGCGRLGLGGGYYIGGGATGSLEPTFRSAPSYLTGMPTRPTRPPAQGGSATVTPANFATVLAGLAGTEGTLYCQGGNYGSSFNITKVPGGGMVRLCAADPANPPYWSSTATIGGTQPFQFNGAGNLWFDGWEFRQQLVTNEADPVWPGSRIVTLYGCSNMRFTRCRPVGSIGSSRNIGGGTAFALYGCDNIAFDRNTFGADLGHGFWLQKSGTTRCTRIYTGFNTATMLGIDLHEMGSVDGFISEYNVRNESKYGKDDFHADDHQCFQTGGELGVRNVWIRKHISIATLASAYVDGVNSSGVLVNAQQNVFCTDETDASAYPNWVVDDCWLLGTSNHAINNQAGPINWTVRGNQVIPSNRTDAINNNIMPKIEMIKQTGEAVDNILIQDNVTGVGAILISSGATNVTQSGNTTIGRQDDTYLTNVFNTALAERALYY